MAHRAVHPTADISLGPRALRALETTRATLEWFARHWLALVSTGFLIVLAGSAAAPLLMALGLPWLAAPLFDLYRLLCHQLPHRSFFIFDHQMAICQRDVAIYAAIGLGGPFFAPLRRRLRPLPWRWYGALLAPIAVDGLSQLVGLRESTWELRVLTGGLFGIATVWLAYPQLDSLAATLLSPDFAAETPDAGSRRARQGGQGTGGGLEVDPWR